MRLTFEVTDVFILQRRSGTDKVTLCTTASSPMPQLSDEPLCLCFDVAANDGPEYVRQLGILSNLVEVIRV